MKYVKGFDGLRAVSILFVLVSHLGFYNYLIKIGVISYRFSLLLNGTAGVYMFFGLSGFLITRILLREKERSGRVNYLAFYAKRFLRLLPPLLLFFSLAFLCMYYSIIPRTYGGLLLAVAYLYNFAPNKYYTGELAHTWSLAIEEQFYLIWPFIITLCNRKRLLLAIFILMAGSLLSVVVLPYVYFPVDGEKIYLTASTHPERFFFPAVGPIMIGSAFAVFVHFYSEKMNRIFNGNYGLLALAMVVYCVPLLITEKLLSFSFVFLSLGATGILVWVFHNQGSLLTRVLEFKPIAYIGKISYGLYVYQGFFLRNGPHSGTLSVQEFPLNIALTFLLAIVSYELYEKYFLRLKKKISEKTA